MYTVDKSTLLSELGRTAKVISSNRRICVQKCASSDHWWTESPLRDTQHEIHQRKRNNHNIRVVKFSASRNTTARPAHPSFAIAFTTWRCKKLFKSCVWTENRENHFHLGAGHFTYAHKTNKFVYCNYKHLPLLIKKKGDIVATAWKLKSMKRESHKKKLQTRRTARSFFFFFGFKSYKCDTRQVDISVCRFIM